jgi:hypothetical protein
VDDVVWIEIEGGDKAAEYNQLYAWLNGNRDFRGRVTRVIRPATVGQLGGIIELLEVALGSGGVATALAPSLTAWLQRNQHPEIAITVTRGKSKVTVNAKGVPDPQALLQDVLRATDEL